MKLMSKAILAAVLVFAGAMASETALAHRGRVSIGVGFGFGFPGGYYPGWYPAPYYYPPSYPYYDPYYPAYGYPAVPTTYVEQGTQAAPAQPQGQWWYYCAEAKAYYPYVRECAGGWQRVAPTPPGG
jgi:hypothetical protein